MKKLILIPSILIGIAALLLLVWAVDEGDIITQEQLDGVDADTINLQCRVEDANLTHLERIRYINDELSYVRSVSCLSIREAGENLYEIIREFHYPYFTIEEYLQCHAMYPALVCNQYYNHILRYSHQNNIQAIRNTIRSYQTENVPEFEFEDEFIP